MLKVIITAIITAVDKAIPTSKSVRPESTPISDETRALIKEKRKLRRLYSRKKDPAVKTRINKLQTQVKEDLNPISTGLFCLVAALGRGGVFHPPSITPLSLKLDCSNFVRRYFQIG